MKKYEEIILNRLLDQYERSKSFVGATVRNQSFQEKIINLFPGYDDSSKFELFTEVNAHVSKLESMGLIEVKRLKRGKIDSDVISVVKLVTAEIERCYSFLNRKPKAETNSEITELLMKYKDKSELLDLFCSEQLIRLSQNKKVQHYDNVDQYEQILKVLAVVECVEEETFVRNFSIRVLGDSKAFERIKSAIVSILCEYRDYQNRETVLEGLNIVKNPGYVYVKGKGIISVAGQVIDLTRIDGAIGLSSSMLDDIERIEVVATKVITIENLTTFHSYVDEEAFIIYLGGYHNSIRRKMICKLYADNPTADYFHYGDIDAGGFYILLDLKRKTGIEFEPLNMDVSTLVKYDRYTKRLTDGDRVRLQGLNGGEFHEVITYMLEHNCKLEQEAIDYFDDNV